MEHLQESTVREHLKPHHDVLAQIVRNSYNLWNDKIAPLFPEPLARTRAQNISNAYHNEAKATFTGKPGIHVVSECERLILVIGNLFGVRFKRMTKYKRTSNYPTPSSLAMDAQRQTTIDGLGPLPRVVVGYTLSRSPETLDGIYVVYAINNVPSWAYSIDGSDDKALVMNFNADPLPEHEFRLIDETEEAEEDASEK